jgi:hypothetical protein
MNKKILLRVSLFAENGIFCAKNVNESKLKKWSLKILSKDNKK